MVTVVFVPGILGSRLALNGEEIWPPTAIEVVTGYRRIDKLLSPAVVASGVIERECVPVYGPLLDALRGAGVREGGSDLLVPWAYDWRRDLEGLAGALADDLDWLASGRTGDIVLVCHSMGGLVARACMETAANGARAFQPRVKLAMFLATPHRGAPLAVARAMGTGGSSLGLSADQLRRLCGADGFPADYQLFPDAAEPVIWRTDGAQPLSPQSLDAAGLPALLGLNAASVARAFAFQRMLDASRRPADRRYVSVVSASHETMTQFDGSGGTLAPVLVKSAGDGTVPIQSAAALDDQTAFVVADHVGVAKAEATLSLVLMLLGKAPQGPAGAGVGGAHVARPTLSLSHTFIPADQAYEVLIALPPGLDRIQGEVAIELTMAAEGGAAATAAIIRLDAHAPGLGQLSLRGPRLVPGQYAFVLRTESGEQDRRALVVSPPLTEAG